MTCYPCSISMARSSTSLFPDIEGQDRNAAVSISSTEKGRKAIVQVLKRPAGAYGAVVSSASKRKLDASKKVEIARAYEKGGAACLSVLTDEKYFKGSFENLEFIRKAGVKCPLLCKEFIVDAWQLYYARIKGADAVLLIAAVLPDLDISYMIKICKILGLTALVEYGPFWICTTLIFVAASIGTFVTYVTHKLKKEQWNYDINLVTWSAGLFYGYVIIVPLYGAAPSKRSLVRHPSLVFDGHGGKHAANFACHHLPKFIVVDESFPSDFERIVASAFWQIDNAFAEA